MPRHRGQPVGPEIANVLHRLQRGLVALNRAGAGQRLGEGRGLLQRTGRYHRQHAGTKTSLGMGVVITGLAIGTHHRDVFAPFFIDVGRLGSQGRDAWEWPFWFIGWPR